jgi:hypothetical protein
VKKKELRANVLLRFEVVASCKIKIKNDNFEF